MSEERWEYVMRDTRSRGIKHQIKTNSEKEKYVSEYLKSKGVSDLMELSLDDVCDLSIEVSLMGIEESKPSSNDWIGGAIEQDRKNGKFYTRD